MITVLKKEVIVWLSKPLTKKERRSFEKDHPGYKLSFMLRYPKTPLIISLISLTVVITKLILEERS